jgi:methionyl-tRNA formyltransferase
LSTTIKILFLGRENSLIPKFLKSIGLNIHYSEIAVYDLSKYDLILSFGYRHIITPTVLATAKHQPINLHISLLPYNRGAHPNFWSHYDGTPSGVSIHLMDDGIDTGPILLQKQISFSLDQKTFRQRYNHLVDSVEKLFISNLSKILNFEIEAIQQIGIGSFHLKSDLPANFKGWDSDIEEEIKRLKKCI